MLIEATIFDVNFNNPISVKIPALPRVGESIIIDNIRYQVTQISYIKESEFHINWNIVIYVERK